VGSDRDVAAATARLDRMSPQTWYDLVRARLAAQSARGIPEDKQAPLYSSQVDDIMVPLMMRAGRGDEIAIVAHLRRDCRIRFGTLGERVLTFLLRSYKHHDTSALLAIVNEGIAA
jgi:hypothetical protein